MNEEDSIMKDVLNCVSCKLELLCIFTIRVLSYLPRVLKSQ